jgi:alpha-1,2-mannosyltransferase
VDSVFFHKLSIVPWNIVAYNVLGGVNRGPNIFGTEPWTFYIRNLLLNFNVWFVLALSAAPLLTLHVHFRPQITTTGLRLQSLPFVFVLPFYLWLGIFTLQPHKEERFMYPAYPFLALNAAIALDVVLVYIGSKTPGKWIGRIPANFKLIAVLAFFLLAIHFSLLRTLGVVTAYNAPLNILSPLEKQGIGQAGDFVCFGKEWYRFPSSFFLPNNMRMKFVTSEFRGLLPGEFADAQNIQMLLEGTSKIPSGMNDQNKEDPGKYVSSPLRHNEAKRSTKVKQVDLSKCSFLVDSYLPGVSPSKREPLYVFDQSNWEKVSCSKFLDASSTSMLGRIAWIPNLPVIPHRHRRHWGQYCLLRRRRSDGQVEGPLLTSPATN